MTPTGTVARLTTDIDRTPGGLIGQALRIILLLQIGRVTLGTHHIPGLIEPCPMQWIARLHLLAWIEMKPPKLPGIPSNGEALQTTS